MQRISPRQSFSLVPFLQKTFLSPSTNNPSLSLILLILQCTTFLYILNTPTISPTTTPTTIPTISTIIIGTGISQFAWLWILVLCLAVRICLGGTLVRLVYCGCICWLAWCRLGDVGGLCYGAVLGLLVVNVGIDVLVHIEFHFCTRNPFSQTHNITKPLHYAAMCTTLVLHVKNQQLEFAIPAFVLPIISIILFLGLFLLKYRSKAKNTFLRQLTLRFYLLAIGWLLKNLLHALLPSTPPGPTPSTTTPFTFTPIYQNILVIIITQLLFSFIEYRCGAIQPEIQISNRNIVKVVYMMLCYLYGDVYDEGMEEAIREFMAVNNKKQKKNTNNHGAKGEIGDMDEQIMDKQQNAEQVDLTHYYTKSHSRPQKKFSFFDNLYPPNPHFGAITSHCLHLLQKSHSTKSDNTPQLLLLIAGIYLEVHHNVLMAKKVLVELKEKIGWWSGIVRLCVWKLEEKINRKLEECYQGSDSGQYFQEFYQNQAIRDSIIKSTSQHLQLWKSVQPHDTPFPTLLHHLHRTLTSHQSLTSLYTQTPKKCRNIILLYIEYLYMVRRDVEATIAHSRQFEIYKEAQYGFDMDNKIYFCVGMGLGDGERMTVEGVGFNVKRLLGYERAGVKFRGIGMFLPRFFVEEHARIVEQALKDEYFGLYVFSKQTMIRHMDDYYLPAKIQLKLVYNPCQPECSLKMQGYILIQQQRPSAEQYTWPNYFFLSEQEQIIQVGPTITDIIELKPRQFVHCDDYFENYQDGAEDTVSNRSLLEGLDGNSNSKSSKSAISTVNKAKFLFHNGVQYEYTLLRILKAGGHKQYRYYVCKNKQQSLQQQHLFRNKILSHFQDYLSQYLQYQKYPLKYQDFQTNIESYLTQKQKICQRINWKGITLAFGAIVALFMVAFVLQGVLISRVEVVKAGNQVLKGDLENLVEFYHGLNNVGMVLKRGAFRVRKGKNFDYEYYSMQALIVDLQARNQYLQKFDIKKYDPALSSTSTLHEKKSLKQLITQLLSNLLTTSYTSDPILTSLCYRNINNIFPIIWGPALIEYSSVYIQNVNESVSEDTKIKIIFGVILMSIMGVIYGLGLWIDWKGREWEYETVDLISGLNAGVIFCNGIGEFLRRAVGGISDRDFVEGDGGKRNKVTNQHNTNNRSQLASTISARQNSVRGFFQQSMINSNTTRQNRPTPGFSNFHQQPSTIPYNTLQLKQRREQNQHERKLQKMRPISKPFLLLWTSLLLLILLLTSVHLAIETSDSQLSLTKSIKNLLTILNKETAFSSTIVSFLDMLSLDRDPELFMKAYGNYEELDKGGQNIVFEEAKYKEFGEFMGLYQNISYVYLCEYMECQPKYKQQINIMYNSAVHKLVQLMFKTINSSTSSSTPSDPQLQFLFYSHYLLQKTSYTLLSTYLRNHKTYSQNKYTRMYTLYECQLVAAMGFLTIAVVYWVWGVRRGRRRCLGFLGVVRKESYMCKDSET